MTDKENMSKNQNNACAICKSGDKKLVVDHDHTTGKIRELLCNSCNRALGHIKENPVSCLSMHDYILKHKT